MLLFPCSNMTCRSISFQLINLESMMALNSCQVLMVIMRETPRSPQKNAPKGYPHGKFLKWSMYLVVFDNKIGNKTT